MFWKKAVEKYGRVDKNDEDIQRYFQIMDQLQDDGYKGLSGLIHDVGHKFASRHTNVQGRTLEIGFGKGRQAKFYKGESKNYYPTDVNQKYVNPENWSKYENAKIVDARELPYENEFFDTVISIYNLEHIRDVTKVLKEVTRVLKPQGKFLVALPCEDGFLYNLSRELTTRRIFTKKYGINYDKVIAYEHVNSIRYLRKVLFENFTLEMENYLPFRVPAVDLNMIYCSVLRKKLHLSE